MIGWQDKADKFDEDEWNQRWKDGVEEENERALTDGGIEEATRGLLRRYRDFRRAADAVTTAWREYRQVVAVSLIGSVAREPWKEVPRFAPYRRARIELWHECTDVDLALWLSDTGNLNEFRRVRARTLRALVDENCHGVASGDGHSPSPGPSDAWPGQYEGRHIPCASDSNSAPIRRACDKLDQRTGPAPRPPRLRATC